MLLFLFETLVQVGLELEMLMSPPPWDYRCAGVRPGQPLHPGLRNWFTSWAQPVKWMFPGIIYGALKERWRVTEKTEIKLIETRYTVEAW